jgi:hypothetical protein
VGEPREQDKASSSESRSAMLILSAFVGADASSVPQWKRALFGDLARAPTVLRYVPN